MFVRAYSGWSLGCGLVQPDTLLRWAKQSALPAVGLADFNNLYGTIPFYETAMQAGVKPIVAAVITAPDERDIPASQRPDEEEPETDPLLGQTRRTVRNLYAPQVVALACEPAGYESLCRLITSHHLSHNFNLIEATAQHQHGMVYLVQDPQLLTEMAQHIEPGRLFAEICDYGDQISRTRNYRLLNAAQQAGIEPVASHAAYFTKPEDWDLHRILRAGALNTLADRVDGDALAPRNAHLVPADHLRRRLAGYGRALYNAEKLLERCDPQISLGVPHFPRVVLPPGQSACARLCRLTWDGLARRYAHIPPQAIPRLEHELRIITKMDFADYFLAVHEIMQFTRSKNIGCVGRGSAADSLVTYCLGISHVDPLRYNLHFERFLNESRTDYPDIDLDIDWRRRDEAIQFVYQHWGSSHVAMICTHHYYKARSAFHDVARALGMPTEKRNKLAKKLPYDEPANLRQAIATLPQCRGVPMHDAQVARTIAIAERLSGLPRGISVHVGGVVISQRDITCHTPLQPSTKGIAISQYDLHAIARVGLIKIDLLGHRSLAILADTLQMVQRHHGRSIDLEQLPEDDPDTTALLVAGRTIGCFQIESPGVRQLLLMLRARDLRDIIHALSLIRPGPAASGMKERFIKRKLGLEKITSLRPAMDEALGDTYGVMLYQEDVMLVAAAVAGFTMATGDSLRKAIEQPDSAEHLAGMKRQFLAGAAHRNCSAETAEQIWLQVSNFAAYAYNKAHACTYGRISYWCTWMKAHWPAEFFVGVLNNIGGYYSLAEYLEEARRLKVPILPPHVNQSGLEYTAEPLAIQPVEAKPRPLPGGRGDCAHESHQTRDLQGGGRYGLTRRRIAIRVPLLQVRNLTSASAQAIVHARHQSPFVCLEDLLERVRLSVDEARALVLSGACDGLGTSRPAMLWQVAMRWRQPPVSKQLQPSQGRLLFADSALPEPLRAGPLALPAHLMEDYSKKRLMELERHYLSFSPANHPLAVWQEELAREDIVRSIDLPRLAGRKVTIAGIVVAMRRAATKTRELMQFVSLEDRFGLVEVVLFPDAYRRLAGAFGGDGPFLVAGTVQENLGTVVLIGQTVRPLRAISTDIAHNYRQKLPADLL